MSTATLPNYPAPAFSRTPSYTAEPQAHEQRLAAAVPVRRSAVDFVKQSKGGHVSLRLSAQADHAQLPVYGRAGIVEGTIKLAKQDGVTSVEVKIEGRLHLKEIAEGGTTTSKLCLDTALLWVKDPSNAGVCPSSLPFRLSLPTTFTVEGRTYPLPPSYEVHLSGVPGFSATVEYSVSAVVNRPNSVPSIVPLVRSSLFGISIGSTTVSTPFVYYPRTRPASPLPLLLKPTRHGLAESSDWRAFESSLKAKTPGTQDIVSKLFLPAHRTFCMSQEIPFHLLLSSSAVSLAAFIPFGPTAGGLVQRRATRIEVMRQSTVDVRGAVINGTKTDIWRVDNIGSGSFRLMADGPDWIAFEGTIGINPGVTVPGFHAGGLTVKDCIVLTITPPDPARARFRELRQLVPVRLTTDGWAADGTGLGARFAGSEYSVPSSPEDYEDAPALAYA